MVKYFTNRLIYFHTPSEEGSYKIQEKWGAWPVVITTRVLSLNNTAGNNNHEIS